MDLDRLYIPATIRTRINLQCDEFRQHIGSTLERKLQDKYQGRCLQQGYIKPGTIRLVEKNKGKIRAAHFNGQVTYDVVFKADIFIPTIGSIVKARVRNNNKAGILAIADPLQIIVARQGQFNHDVSMFDQYQIGDIVNIKILEFRIEPETIYAVGSLESVVIQEEKSFMLPLIALDLSNLQINLVTTDSMPDLDKESYGDPEPLNKKKSQIDKWDTKPNKLWSNYVRYFINPYELLANPFYNRESVIKFQKHWKWNDPKHRDQGGAWVTTGESTGIEFKPFSRAYYKLTEVLHDFQVLREWQNRPLHILNLAEGPGGFIHAIIDRRGKLEAAQSDKYLAITLKRSGAQSRVKDWDSELDAQAYFAEQDKDITLTYGADDQGDLTNPVNIQWLQDQYTQEDDETAGADLITADGGIDTSSGGNYNYQEMMNYKLIYSQIIAALGTQREGGTFIVKIFDIYTDVTAQMLQLIEYFYDKVAITKPLTSRPANSERYVVAQGFRGWNTQMQKENFMTNLVNGLTQWNERESDERKPADKYEETGFFVTSIMDTNIDPKLQEIVRLNNEEFVARQIKKIDEGLDLVQSGNLGNPDVQKNIKTHQRPTAFKWCQEYLGENYCNVGIKISTQNIPGLSDDNLKKKIVVNKR